MAQDFEIRLSEADQAQLVRDIRNFPDDLRKATRKRLRDAAQPAVKDVQRRLMGRTFKTDTGLARGLAAGTKVSIRTGTRNAGVSITTTGAKLPEAKQAMVRAYNKRSFRHPVYGNRDVWVNQNGRPYFGAVLDERRAGMAAAVQQALTDAAEQFHTGEPT